MFGIKNNAAAAKIFICHSSLLVCKRFSLSETACGTILDLCVLHIQVASTATTDMLLELCHNCGDIFHPALMRPLGSIAQTPKPKACFVKHPNFPQTYIYIYQKRSELSSGPPMKNANGYQGSVLPFGLPQNWRIHSLGFAVKSPEWTIEEQAIVNGAGPSKALGLRPHSILNPV